MEDREKKHASRDVSVEEILAEAKGRISAKTYAQLIDESEQGQDPVLKDARAVRERPPADPAPEQPVKVEPGPEKLIPPDGIPQEAPASLPEKKAGGTRFAQRSKEKRGFFGRRKEKNKGFEEEEDIYYGLQLKPIGEYKKGYEEERGESSKGPSSEFSYLFDETQEEDVDEKIAVRFEQVHKSPSVKKASNEGKRVADRGKVVSIYSHSDPNKKDSLEELLGEDPALRGNAPNSESTVEFKMPGSSVQKKKEPMVDLEKAAAYIKKTEPAAQAPEQEKPKEEQGEAIIEKALEGQQKPACKIEADPKDQPVETEQKFQEKPAVMSESEKTIKKDKIKALLHSVPPYRIQETAVHLIEIDQIGCALAQEAQGYELEEKPEETQSLEENEKEEGPRVKWKIGKKKKAGGTHRFHFTGETEEDNDPSEELPEEPAEIDDFTSEEDAPSIRHDLDGEMRTLVLRFMVTGILSLLLALWGFLSERYVLMPEFLQFGISGLVYLIVNTSFLIIAMAFCWPALWNGLKGLVRLQANSDSAVAVAAVAALLQSAAAFFAKEELMGNRIHLYTVLAAAALFLNTAGKLTMIRRIKRNFYFVSSPEQKTSVALYDDYNNALRLGKSCVPDTPIIAYQKKTGFLKHFLRNSYESDPSELASQMLAPITFIGSLILCIVTMVLSGDVIHALTAFTAAACISVPFTNMLAVNLPVGRLCKLARRCGAMLVGYPAVEYFCNTNAVMLDAKDLFPKGTVILNGLKTFGGERVDEAIMEATALMCAAGGPLSDLFEQIIKNKRDMLPKVENISYEDERGIVGWVAGKRVLIGNRDLMEEHRFTPPSHDYEDKYLLGGKKVVYLASGGELVAMFIVSYNSDKRRALELQRMDDNGISLIVRTSDPNITPPFLAQCFGVDVHSIRVLPEQLGELYQKLVHAPAERTEALFATKGRPTAMMRLLTACVREKSNVTIATVLQNVAVVLGFVLVAFLACYSGLQQLSTTSLLIYEVFWILVVLIVPRLRKP